MERSEMVFEWLARRRNVTVEKWLRYAVEKIKADGHGDIFDILKEKSGFVRIRS